VGLIAAVVVNPIKVAADDDRRQDVEDRLAEAGWAPALWLETTEEDPGQGMAAEAIAGGADMVLAFGGDGTVRAVLTSMAGSGIPMAVLPLGTGNLLARNLGLPLDDLSAAVRVALEGAERALDVGRLEPARPGGSTERFAVMAGVGFDAAMMRDAPEGLKSRLGWPAYLISAVRNLPGSGFTVTVTVDGDRPVRARARTVLVANVGQLQGGLVVVPDAVPDDGLLDVALIGPGGVVDWLRLAGRLIRRGDRQDHRYRTFRGRRITVTTRRQHPREADGDLIGPGRRLVAEVEPGAVIIRVPA
jgi:diacylglycerol kinase (ATP)